MWLLSVRSTDDNKIYDAGCWSDEEGWRRYNRGRLLALQGVSREAKGDRPVRYAMCEITITPNALPSTQLGFRAPIHSHEVSRMFWNSCEQ